MRGWICLTLGLVLFLVSDVVSVVEVDSEVRSSVEEFLRTHSNLRMDDLKPLKVSPNSVLPAKPKKKHPKLEMVEDALRLIYHELYEAANATANANVTELIKRSRTLNPRQSFFSNGLNSASEYMMSLVENSLEDLPSLPRLEAQECMKRSVCEAHNQPKKYGLIGLVLQLLFPPYTKSEDPNNVVSKYQLAARYGRQSNANCGVQYDGCMLNLLDIVQALVNAFIR
ncbi:uncharacterized protein TNIN_255991 [Trichonephila inaurata madagascariensis]|uniref:Uncharacterized protein n=1 Tax=Trichonephila inaurata madagascariensis TaxID=2747483 RepID=A0A8X6MMD7_9ARAC|nr:uncharacterized protein TNIN_255991 [Trichonephila inaurata madagascariensis]